MKWFGIERALPLGKRLNVRDIIDTTVRNRQYQCLSIAGMYSACRDDIVTEVVARIAIHSDRRWIDVAVGELERLEFSMWEDVAGSDAMVI
jgi:hypothetical protein